MGNVEDKLPVPVGERQVASTTASRDSIAEEKHEDAVAAVEDAEPQPAQTRLQGILKIAALMTALAMSIFLVRGFSSVDFLESSC